MPNLLRGTLLTMTCALLGLTGCTLKGTVQQVTDTTSNVTGTTSGAGWWNEDGQIKPDFKATAFVAFNQDNLRQDLAAGQGEYLASVSQLLGIPAHRQQAFFSAAQAIFTYTVEKEPAALLAFLRNTSKPFID